MRRSSARTSLIVRSEPVIAPRPMNEAISMWSGPIRKRPAVEALDAVDDQAVGADAVDPGAELHQEARQVLHVGLAGRVQDHRAARAR